jgi:hypothetical protein
MGPPGKNGTTTVCIQNATNTCGIPTPIPPVVNGTGNTTALAHTHADHATHNVKPPMTK